MKAVILSAGKGKRLGTITQEITKQMIEIAGKPILEHNILMCKNLLLQFFSRGFFFYVNNISINF